MYHFKDVALGDMTEHNKETHRKFLADLQTDLNEKKAKEQKLAAIMKGDQGGYRIPQPEDLADFQQHVVYPIQV